MLCTYDPGYLLHIIIFYLVVSFTSLLIMKR
jgi:hypothetical protein